MALKRPPALPAIRRQPEAEAAGRYEWLASTGQLLTRWQAEPFEAEPTDCFKVGDEYWIWQPGVGGIRFTAERLELTAYPSATVDPTWFDHLISRSWLPAVYPVWGRQVLHASAVVRGADGSVLAFAGPTSAGKSTLAYALATRPGWMQLSDDTLAFACEGDDLVLHPLQNDARLRPATAAHFGRAADPVVPVPWPAFPLHLRNVLFVESGTVLAQPAAIARLPAAEAYRRLLEQAHAFTLEIADHNRRLMRDYLALTAAVPAFVLSYERSFGAIEQVLDAIERHASAELRTPPARRT